MNILISFCNTLVLPGYPSLGLLNAETMDFKIVSLPPEIPQTGILGIAISSKYLFLGLQHSFDATKAYRSPPNSGMLYSYDGKMANENPPALLIFDKVDFKLLNNYKFNLVRDVHSFCLSKDEKTLYVVSTGTDELMEVKLDEYNVLSENVLWVPIKNGERSDNYHLNSIYEWKDELYISGFGTKDKSQNWSSALNGFIYNITKGEEVVTGLEHPHSITTIDNKLAVCESRKKKVHIFEDKTKVKLQSYTRGLCDISDKIFVGTSARRLKSKSTGKLVEQDKDIEVGCSINCISKETMQVINTKLLNDYANEIYDLIPVENTHLWPLHEPRNYKEEFSNAWNEQVQKAVYEIQEVIPMNEGYILVDDCTWGDEPNILNNKRFNFIEKNGVYWGLPDSYEVAINELDLMQKEQDVHYIFIAWTCFWWIKSHQYIYNYLRDNFVCVINNERVIGFYLNKESNDKLLN